MFVPAICRFSAIQPFTGANLRDQEQLPFVALAQSQHSDPLFLAMIFHPFNPDRQIRLTHADQIVRPVRHLLDTPAGPDLRAVRIFRGALIHVHLFHAPSLISRRSMSSGRS